MNETNEERLENMSPIGVDGNGNVLIKGEDWHWLGEQAERVPELEKEVNGLYWRNEWLKSQEENERLRGALAFYADHDNFKTFDSPAIKDCGEKARKALKDVE